jgi:dTDP-4-dehydrorhamnose 3,5-epimerase-like enzyme
MIFAHGFLMASDDCGMFSYLLKGWYWRKACSVFVERRGEVPLAGLP